MQITISNKGTLAVLLVLGLSYKGMLAVLLVLGLVKQKRIFTAAVLIYSAC